MTKNTLGNMDLGTAKVEDKDVVGNSFGVLDTDIYPFYINEAFIEPAKSGAVGIHLTLKEKKDGSGKVLEKTSTSNLVMRKATSLTTSTKPLESRCHFLVTH